MKIAFYAPMKSPAHGRPSGDRHIARLFIAALTRAGMEVELASELRSWEGRGDDSRQREIEECGAATAARLIAEYRRRPPADRPRFWFTYHLYHKAPDWLGPAVSRALDIPYIVAEASVAGRRRDGRWRRGYESSVAAIRHAHLIFNLNPADAAGLRPHVGAAARAVSITPFHDIPPPRPGARARLRAVLGARLGWPQDSRWLLSVAMMRDDSKLRSYQTLAAAAEALAHPHWRLLVVGDGPARPQVEAAFRGLGSGRVHFLGRRERVYSLMRACDLFVWPAHNEALGLVTLEALGCGLPVVAGRAGGIAQMVRHGVTGLLVDSPSPGAMAQAVDTLLADAARLGRMRADSLAVFRHDHRLDMAAKAIGCALTPLIQAPLIQGDAPHNSAAVHQRTAG